MIEVIARLFPNSEGWVHFWNTLEFGREEKTPWFAGFIGVMLLAAWLYRRDAVGLKPVWKVWLTALRGSLLLLLLGVALMPQERKSRVTAQASRVVILLDTSASMAFAAGDRPATASQPALSRAAAVQALLEKSRLLDALSQTHEVSIYTLDSQQQAVGVLPKRTAGPPAGAPVAAAQPAADKPLVWEKVLKPRLLETRLGEALVELIRKENGETLSGIVVITDGQSNAGVDPISAVEAASSRVRLFPIGVGGVRRPANLRLAEVQASSHVHVNDGFTINALVVGQEMAGKPVIVDLLMKRDQEAGEPTLLETREISLLEDGVPVAVAFEYTPTDPGKREFLIRVKPRQPTIELSSEDNQRIRTTDVVDRKTKVLLIAGGPMREYQFVRNLLHRDKSLAVDVWLQTGGSGISQESNNLLTAFPETREELFDYDVIVAFDPNWRQILGEKGDGAQLLSEWVFTHAGGLVLVAGDVNTAQLAGAPAAQKQELEKVFELYPVVLDPHIADFEDFQQPWPIEFTREGRDAEFLQLTDNPTTSAESWKEFAGVFRCQPTDGPKAGATVYAHFTDPRTANSPPILLASQFFGSGRVLYLGSAEFWRLRALDEDYYDRLWVKLVREAGQGRLLRGTSRGILLLERKEFPLGATVQVRARVLDPQFKAYQGERVPLEVFDPAGKPLAAPVDLLLDKDRPGNYSGAFVAGVPGTYHLELPIPESNLQLKDEFVVVMPNLESDHPEQNVQLLKALAREREAGGRYLAIDEAAARLPALLPDRSAEKVEFDVPRPLWDRESLLYAAVTLLTLEWLTRKLLKLA